MILKIPTDAIKEICKKVPPIAWIIIALGVFALLTGGGIALAKYGHIIIRREHIEKPK